MTTTKYKRVLLKLSGEACSGEKNYGMDAATLSKIAQKIKRVMEMEVGVAVVVGGGNIWRWAQAEEDGIDRLRRWSFPKKLLDTLDMKNSPLKYIKYAFLVFIPVSSYVFIDTVYTSYCPVGGITGNPSPHPFL